MRREAADGEGTAIPPRTIHLTKDKQAERIKITIIEDRIMTCKIRIMMEWRN